MSFVEESDWEGVTAYLVGAMRSVGVDATLKVPKWRRYGSLSCGVVRQSKRDSGGPVSRAESVVARLPTLECSLQGERREIDVRVSARGDINFYLPSDLDLMARDPESVQQRSRVFIAPTEDSVPLNAVPVRVIGQVRSVWKEKLGTPRQPGLVTGALGAFELASDLTADYIHGLDEFSHMWILFLFHQDEPTLKPLVKPPRAPSKWGALACRTPHRPSQIGLSPVRIERVTGRVVVVSGLDLVDGTPVVDIKPYHPMDRVASEVPAWASEAAMEPIMPVKWADTARRQLANIILGYELEGTLEEVEATADSRLSTRRPNRFGGRSPFEFYESRDGFMATVSATLAHDPRSPSLKTETGECPLQRRYRPPNNIGN
ncbi:MAG: uncharacterized protein KVP18_004592 [Porospora cf. gigantea A]|uniref:uncharacterized protein n=1 Tax=Porospora cf. gigantea A TaxID=2853593 RepID=UPI00355AB239|nr:MAG: hypothetical protein KVP18_004592 [Porospora cf. gigantea A]